MLFEYPHLLIDYADLMNQNYCIDETHLCVCAFVRVRVDRGGGSCAVNLCIWVCLCCYLLSQMREHQPSIW